MQILKYQIPNFQHKVKPSIKYKSKHFGDSMIWVLFIEYEGMNCVWRLLIDVYDNCSLNVLSLTLSNKNLIPPLTAIKLFTCLQYIKLRNFFLTTFFYNKNVRVFLKLIHIQNLQFSLVSGGFFGYFSVWLR